MDMGAKFFGRVETLILSSNPHGPQDEVAQRISPSKTNSDRNNLFRVEFLLQFLENKSPTILPYSLHHQSVSRWAFRRWGPGASAGLQDGFLRRSFVAARRELILFNRCGHPCVCALRLFTALNAPQTTYSYRLAQRDLVG